MSRKKLKKHEWRKYIRMNKLGLAEIVEGQSLGFQKFMFGIQKFKRDKSNLVD